MEFTNYTRKGSPGVIHRKTTTGTTLFTPHNYDRSPIPAREAYAYQPSSDRSSSTYSYNRLTREDRNVAGEAYCSADLRGNSHGRYPPSSAYDGKWRGESCDAANPVNHGAPTRSEFSSTATFGTWEDNGLGHAKMGTPQRENRKTDFSKQQRLSVQTLEVAPGEFLRLRGAEETWTAIQCGFYTPCECICCCLALVCIRDADCVLCPTCRVVSPTEGFRDGDSSGGVGLGCKREDLPWSKKNFKDDSSERYNWK
jgi:hypothetical protein